MVLQLEGAPNVFSQKLFPTSPEDNESLQFAGEKELTGGTFTEKTGGIKSPTTTGTNDNVWSNPADAFSEGGGHASTQLLFQDYSDFAFNLPSNAIITGIEVTLDMREQNIVDEGAVGIELS